ncbi:hypothetical protein ACFVUW_28845 [Streptomyces xiamenensis]|uniref:hypothetical protein n=1 Tax=Streptomyces xiamenensis TaxID=408015 RepID=UPI0036E4C604
MSSGKGSSARLDRAGIADTYAELPRTVDAWVKLLNFPSPVAEEEWDARQVDDWVRVSRPQSWPARSRRPDPSAKEPSVVQGDTEGVAETPVPDTSGEDELMGKAGLALRYGVSEATVGTWARAEHFPQAADAGRWRTRAVDGWVKEHRAHAWAEVTGEGPKVVIAPPDGNPKDLYDIGGYGFILGNATRGEPLPRTTAQSYKRQGHLEPPDRVPGDRKRPEVFEDMWFLQTITRHVYSRRGPGRLRAGRTRRTGKKRA